MIELTTSVSAEAIPGFVHDGPGPHTTAPLRSAVARFLELRGRRIVKGCGAIWYLGPGRFLVSLPFQTMLNPDRSELRSMIRDTGAFGARFPSSSWTGLESGMYVMSTREYDIESVHEEQRSHVRRGLEHSAVRLATKSQLLKQGYALNRHAMARRGWYDPEFGDRRRWETLVEAAFTCSSISVPAAFCGPQMAAYMVVCREGRWLHILHHISAPQELPGSPSDALTYAVTQQAAADPALDGISYGYVPLGSPGSFDEYKMSFGYRVQPHRSAIQLHPLLDAVLNGRVARAAVRFARSFDRKHAPFHTIESILEGAHSSGPSTLVARPC
jgi:hypothetical protein